MLICENLMCNPFTPYYINLLKSYIKSSLNPIKPIFKL